MQISKNHLTSTKKSIMRKLEDVYTSGKKLAEDLLKKVDYESAIKMLVFAANMNPEIKVLKSAVNACKRLNDQ